ncbi:glycosyltransferase family 4 protein [Antarcticibacterium flavum]|uniref:Glycosyltransferase family 4 protein n=1 Tax=Antarcticibacterium flavum TaxID=2058175 RepID=A0A5B7X043_9FLAO|nr:MULTISPECIES: glycosyltransferase family 4 protein [Antarcticibacterium]MCM4158759.1 glycosyltransferase family 1 protein [Antarcticibacterium sp. W02-3]QCY68610.1 glycosyltransferase family 4 protein [Antarcticibacterium flavum]
MQKLIRITTIPLSLEKLLEGQLTYMSEFYEVTAVAAEKERLEKYGRENGVKTFWVEMTRAITPAKDMKAVWKLYKFFKKEKPLIVHTHTPKAGITGMLAAKMAGVPIRLHTVAGLPLLETTGTKRKILDAVEKLTYKLATRIYPNSAGLKEIILAEGYTREEKLKILGRGSSNGIDTAYFNPESYPSGQNVDFKTKTGIPQEDLVFIFIGRLVSEKGINELVAAFKKLQLAHSNISLLLVGPLEEDLDPLKPATLEEIEKNPKIFTTGYQQDVRPYLAISNVLAFPSYREGFPNVVMQAGAMGLPAIVSDINGCNEIIKQDKNGIIIPVKDQEALYYAMKSLINDEIRRKSLSAGARDEICSKYDRKEFWKILKEEYELLEVSVKKT